MSAFTSYVSSVEGRLAEQHRSQATFLSRLSGMPQNEQRLRQNELIIEQITPGSGVVLDGALLHHWRGTAFVRGAKAADFERSLRDIDTYPQQYSPQVLQAGVLTRRGDHLVASMRVRQRHVIPVVMDLTCDVSFGQLDAQHRHSKSRSIRIAEIDSAGLRQEHALGSSEEHGFLWRLNTYWSYEENAGGLYLQIETISLSRSIPPGLGWVLGPYVESVPRESLEFTLRSASKVILK